MLIHIKDDIEFVTEFPCFLGPPVLNLTQFYINFSRQKFEYNFHGSGSRAKVISFQPIPLFVFPLHSL